MTKSIMAISPIDGRYKNKTNSLTNYFSEYGLIQYRIQVEIEYFIALAEMPLPQLADFDHAKFIELRDIYLDFDVAAAEKVKATEAITNHDVKAVEYYIKDEFKKLGLEKYSEFVHFGLTSQDINNTAIPLSIKEAMDDVYMPFISDVIVTLTELASELEEVPMLARTHGQPASPTRLGKEIMVFVERLDQQMRQMRHIPNSAKFGGATGNFNAHTVAYPDIDWHAFGDNFVADYLGLQRSSPTTQIEHYDNMAAYFDNLSRINTILLDLSRDVWTYVSMEYFKQKIKAGEIGSSAMPHKVNPIDFENSEGNLGIANAIFEHLSAKLPVSRLQRDLTDSTVLRNVGVPFAHTIIAFKSTLKGLQKLLLNTPKIAQDLENNWAVVAEAIQTILRREGFSNPYEALKGLTRTNAAITQDSIADFIDTLEVSDAIKTELKTMEPDLVILISKIETPEKIMDLGVQEGFTRAIYAAQNGVYRMSADIPELVETSNNLARVVVKNGKIKIACLTRSSVESSKMDLANTLRSTFELTGCEVELSGDYPGWTPNMDSPILKIMTQLYEDLNGEKPHVAACHAGLECGILGSVYPHWDIISFGPTIRFPHSPDEKVNIETVGKFWDFLSALLENIPVK